MARTFDSGLIFKFLALYFFIPNQIVRNVPEISKCCFSCEFGYPNGSLSSFITKSKI